MTDPQVIRLFAKYNQETNIKMNGIIKLLTDEEWDRGLGGYFKSVRAICSHLYISDYNWAKRFKNIRDYSALNDNYLSNTYGFDNLLFSSKEEYIIHRAKLDTIITAFINEVTPEDLEKNLKFINYHGKEINKNAGGLLLHMFNHETHHRGMISVYLEILGKDNDVYSLMNYVQ